MGVAQSCLSPSQNPYRDAWRVIGEVAENDALWAAFINAVACEMFGSGKDLCARDILRFITPQQVLAAARRAQESV